MNQKTLDRVREITGRWDLPDTIEGRTERIDLTGVNLSGAILTCMDFSYAILDNADLSFANLGRADMRYTSLNKANLSDANGHGTGFSYARAVGTLWCRAYLRAASFFRACLEMGDFQHATLDHADFNQASLVGVGDIWPFSFGKHQGIFQPSTGLMCIGCKERHVNWWVNNYETVGQKHGYSDVEIAMYGAVIKAAASSIGK